MVEKHSIENVRKQMQIVIDIPEKQYNDIIEHYETFPNEWEKWGLQAIKNGTPLPKGHGQLIDGDALLEPFVQHQKDYPNIAINLNFDRFKAIIETAPTIIDADRSDK